MLQPILTPKKMWPGGIPSTARIHQDGDISYDEMREPTKGWSQFVHVFISLVVYSLRQS
jgi:hypothetical protein